MPCDLDQTLKMFEFTHENLQETAQFHRIEAVRISKIREIVFNKAFTEEAINQQKAVQAIKKIQSILLGNF